MASEPYCAAAPSRSTSTCRSAMAGMAEMSGPCEPNATPLPPCQSMTDERWRRLPLTSTSVWSGARLRSIAGRTTVEASLIGWVLTLNDGTTVRSWSCRLKVPRLVRSAVESTSTGTGDAVTVRGCAREPTTTVSSENPASRLSISWGDSPSASTSAASRPRTTSAAVDPRCHDVELTSARLRRIHCDLRYSFYIRFHVFHRSCCASDSRHVLLDHVVLDSVRGFT